MKLYLSTILDVLFLYLHLRACFHGDKMIHNLYKNSFIANYVNMSSKVLNNLKIFSRI